LNVSQAQDYDLRLVVTAALAGLVADTLVRGLKPSAAKPQAMQLFAFTVPTIYYALFFLVLMLIDARDRLVSAPLDGIYCARGLHWLAAQLHPVGSIKDSSETRARG
jgi:hypothetical protein